MLSLIAKHAASIINVANDKVINLRSVQWARLEYVNQYNQTVTKIPNLPTYRNKIMYSDVYLIPAIGMPRESELERATRLNYLDEWLPVLYMKFSASGIERFTGSKALSLWSTWKAKQYNKKN